MSSRFNTDVRAWIYRFLCIRDGEQCANCGRVPTKSQRKSKQSRFFDIHHVDGNPRNNKDENLRLFCRSCNVSESNKRRAATKKKPTGLVCVCASKTALVHKLVRYHEGSAEMSVADYCEPVFREWIEREVAVEGHLTREDAIAGGAEYSGCSIATATRYLKKMTSVAGSYREAIDRTGKVVIVPRD